MTNPSTDMRLLQILSQAFPNSESASTEIINLEAILSLPKGTEHFVADIHGEHEAFLHILRNASGNIRRKVRDLYGQSLQPEELRNLCTLIYYPEKRLEMIEEGAEGDLSDFYARTLLQLIGVCRSVSSKYTRSKVRKALPKQFAYIIEELLHENPNDEDKDAVFEEMFYDIVHEHVDPDRSEPREAAPNQTPKAIRVKNVPVQRKLSRDSVKRVKSETDPGTDSAEEEHREGDEDESV